MLRRLSPWFLLCLPLLASAQPWPQLDSAGLRWIGERVFANECASKPACLTAWNAAEDFPSLGIGHFIWYRAGQEEPFAESFPALLAFLRARGAAVPAWIAAEQDEQPWPTREAFLADLEGARLTELRGFLLDHMDLQAAFIVERFEQARERLRAAADPAAWPVLEARFLAVANAAPPQGLYALIDYVNFKGEGLAPGERYQGQGWGLLQVLETMRGDVTPLDDFAAAASAVLERRVANAPAERGEARWLDGWRKRVASYRLPLTSTSFVPQG